ncbi:MAG TPA: DNA polymerase III subunit gamma/tau [Leucothrix mucor]|nr:DNA polymerase III subunit gamma/tau [Leucothrix mucor]
MSYQVLARKWRPQNFKEMVGQQHVLRALINALEDDRLHHAYLFTGTRGVGKTTIARILAKCLNCETGVTAEPCGECSSCKEIVAGSFVDLIEVDAASRTKVEDTRELLDNVQYAPTRGRFKVYLIDEVHMLTGHSFNALLKTLEEPPPHVKFLFATTDPQKLPVTILSRCLQFNLKRMPVDMISGHLKYLTEQEKITSDEPSLKLLARAADGSMRDALSLLDQSIAFGKGALQEADVREMLGTISHEPLIAMLKAVSAGEGANIIQQIDDMAGVTPDFEAATDALIATLHQVAVQQVVPEAIQDDDSVAELATQLSKEDVQLYYQIALHGRRDIALSPDLRSGFEMILLRMLAFRPQEEGMAALYNPTVDQNKTQEAISEDESISKKKTVTSEPELVARQLQAREIEKALLSNNKPQYKVAEPAPQKIQQTKIAPPSSEDDVPWETLPEELTKPVNSSVKKPIKSSVEKPVSNTANNSIKKNEGANEQKKVTPSSTQISTNAEWHDIVPALKLKGRAAELIKHCLFESKENGIISLKLDKSNDTLLADSIQQEIQTALVTFYGEPLKLKLQVVDSNDINNVTNATIDDTATAPVINAQETPAERTARNMVESQQQAEQNIATDPFVIELQNRFGAQIVPGSVQIK